MIKTFKFLLPLFCLMIFNKTTFATQLNFNELTNSSEELTKYLKIKIAENKTTIDPVEEIEFYLILIEKTNKDPIAYQIVQKLFEQLHKHLKLLVKPAIFENNYCEMIDFIDELFNCKINDKTPFRYSLVYAFLAISRFYELQSQNKIIPREHLFLLRAKIISNFQNAFDNERLNLKKQYPTITKNKINTLCKIIVKATFPEKIPMRWNFSIIVSTTCWASVAIALTGLIWRLTKYFDRVEEKGIPALNKVDRLLEGFVPNKSNSDEVGTGALLIGLLKDLKTMTARGAQALGPDEDEHQRARAARQAPPPPMKIMLPQPDGSLKPLHPETPPVTEQRS